MNVSVNENYGQAGVKSLLTEEEMEENRIKELISQKRRDKFQKKFKKDLGGDIDNFIEFIKVLIKQDSENLHIQTMDGEYYTLKYYEPVVTSNTNNVTATLKQPIGIPSSSSFAIDIRRDQISIQSYINNDVRDRYSMDTVNFYISEDIIYDKVEKIIYDAYIKSMKLSVDNKIIDMYKITKLDRSRKIKNILNDNEE